MWRNLKELGESSVEVGNRSDEDMEVDSDPEDDVPLALFKQHGGQSPGLHS